MFFSDFFAIFFKNNLRHAFVYAHSLPELYTELPPPDFANITYIDIFGESHTVTCPIYIVAYIFLKLF
jgi:hypothetical protein